MTFNMIKKAQIIDNTTTNICKNLSHFARKENITQIQMFESVTHVLAGLEQTAANMSPNSVACFLAGVEKLSDKLATIENSQQKQQVLKILVDASMKYDDITRKSLPNQSVVQIAKYGSRFPELVQKYVKYTTSVDSTRQVGLAARKLRGPIQKAMQTTIQAGNIVNTNSSISRKSLN